MKITFWHVFGGGIMVQSSEDVIGKDWEILEPVIDEIVEQEYQILDAGSSVSHEITVDNCQAVLDKLRKERYATYGIK